jgi:hypothetical protein
VALPRGRSGPRPGLIPHPRSSRITPRRPRASGAWHRGPRPVRLLPRATGTRAKAGPLGVGPLPLSCEGVIEQTTPAPIRSVLCYSVTTELGGGPFPEPHALAGPTPLGRPSGPRTPRPPRG